MKKISLEKLSYLVTRKINELNLTEEELSDLIGVNEQIISEIKSNKHIPSLIYLENILDKLEIDINDIVEDSVDTNVFLAMREEARSIEEQEGLEKMISMMLCLRKHKNIRKALR